ncbi:MAG: alpha/beta fold hydrolase [Spirillospora sp.]
MGGITTGSVTANGLDFGYLTAGPADGPLVLLLHGFPDSAHTWRHLMPELATAGYRAVAPFMRGYAPTSVPEDGAYPTGALAADAVALHEALGGGPDAAVVGHDWGAFAAYGAAAFASGRWRKAVAMSVPPMSVMTGAFFEYEQLKRSFYMFVFQSPIAGAILGRAFIEGLWRDWSPPDPDPDPDPGSGSGAGGRARHNRHAEDIDHVMECLATPDSVTAALGYYRALFDPSRHSDRYAAEQEAFSVMGDVPVLYLHGSEDGCVGADVVAPDGDLGGVLAALPPGSRADLVPDAGHFLQLDRPADVNSRILGWLR